MKSGIVEIAGGIASGKTTLAKALSAFDATVVYENHDVNPFWSAFYENPGEFVFETEITFLLQHYHFAKRSMESEKRVVLDHSFELDMAYATIGLSGKRREIFELAYDEVRSELGLPKKLIWLKCRPEVEFSRIKLRGRKQEENISFDFIKALNVELSRLLADQVATGRVLILDSEAIDFRCPGKWLSNLRTEIEL